MFHSVAELIFRQRFVGFAPDTPVLDNDRVVGMLAMRDIPTEARVLWSNWNRARPITPASRGSAGD